MVLQVLGDLGASAFFLATAWWAWTHEHWATANDRQSWEQRPSRWTTANYWVSVAITRVLAPIALAALGATALAQGIAAIHR